MKRTFTKADLPRAMAWLAAFPFDDKRKYDIEIKQHREKRSLDANAYCWVLIDKLAEKLHYELKQDSESVKLKIYREAIRDIGGVSDAVCVPTRAVERIIEGWEHKGIGWQVEQFESKIDGCTNLRLYYGSSTYDKSQMSRLINNLVQECKAVGGIETLPPNELKGLIEQWK